MQKTIAVALAALFVSTSALAAKWVVVPGQDEPRVEVDASSLHATRDGGWRIWHRETHARAQLPDSGAFSYRRLTRLSEFQCEQRLAATLEASYAAADGSELRNETFDRRAAKTLTPDSGLEPIFTYACKHRPRPATTPVAAIVAAPPPAIVAERVETPKKGKNGKTEETPPPRWTYAGNNGADKWGSLARDYTACSLGQRQAPIDIRQSVRADLPAIQIAHRPVALNIVDDGRGIRIETPGAGTLTVGQDSYELEQISLHRPSEERVNGKPYAMSAHLVHQSKTGKTAVLAVMIEAGKENSLVRTLWTHLPLEQEQPVKRSDLKIDPTLLVPALRGYYTYMGSLTTPPCSEGVLWLVMKTPLQISKEQLAGFATIYKNNVRPVQAVNGRVIKESR